jgi:translocator protein
MKKRTLWAWINVVAVVATIAINGLANALPLNGLTTGEISDRFDVYFVPAGYVFSIWGVIYLGLIAFALYQVLPGQRDNPRLERLGPWFVLSCVANIAWLFLWHYEIFPLTLVAMVALLVSLIGVYLRLGMGRDDVPTAEQWLVRLPFSIYLGWVSVATIANVTSLLDYLGWNGWGISEIVWTIVMLVVGCVLTTLVSLSRRDVAYALVIVWAFLGIAVKHRGTPAVSISAIVAAVWAAGVGGVAAIRRLRR